MTYADDFAAYLGSAVEGLAYSESADGNVFVDRAPSGPDRAVTIYVTPGPEADSLLPYDPVTFQVVVRSEADGIWAANMWDSIRDLLHGLRNTELPGGRYLAFCLSTQASPLRLGDDESGRARYSGNYRAEVIRPSANRPL